MHRRILLFLIVFIMTLSGCGSSRPNSLSCSWYDLFDTYSTFTCYGIDEETFQRYSQIVYDTLNRYHKEFNIYEEYEHNIKTINENAGIAPVAVSQSLWDFLIWGRDVYTLTQGRVNIAMGSVLSVWHTYREAGLSDPQAASLPSDEELREASRHISIENLVLNEEQHTAYLTDPKSSLDIGALGKGYAADRAAEALKDAGCTDAILNLGGNVLCIGPSDLIAKDTFSIGIQSPESESELVMTLRIQSRSVVTSGDYQRYYKVNGTAYHHIIDPDTLYPSTRYHAVTVICDDSATADMLSTALFLLPYEEGAALAAQFEAEAYWMDEQGNEMYTEHFKDSIQ